MSVTSDFRMAFLDHENGNPKESVTSIITNQRASGNRFSAQLPQDCPKLSYVPSHLLSIKTQDLNRKDSEEFSVLKQHTVYSLCNDNGITSLHRFPEDIATTHELSLWLSCELRLPNHPSYVAVKKLATKVIDEFRQEINKEGDKLSYLKELTFLAFHSEGDYSMSQRVMAALSWEDLQYDITQHQVLYARSATLKIAKEWPKGKLEFHFGKATEFLYNWSLRERGISRKSIDGITGRLHYLIAVLEKMIFQNETVDDEKYKELRKFLIRLKTDVGRGSKKIHAVKRLIHTRAIISNHQVLYLALYAEQALLRLNPTKEDEKVITAEHIEKLKSAFSITTAITRMALVGEFSADSVSDAQGIFQSLVNLLSKNKSPHHWYEYVQQWEYMAYSAIGGVAALQEMGKLEASMKNLSKEFKPAAFGTADLHTLSQEAYWCLIYRGAQLLEMIVLQAQDEQVRKKALHQLIAIFHDGMRQPLNQSDNKTWGGHDRVTQQTQISLQTIWKECPLFREEVESAFADCDPVTENWNALLEEKGSKTDHESFKREFGENLQSWNETSTPSTVSLAKALMGFVRDGNTEKVRTSLQAATKKLKERLNKAIINEMNGYKIPKGDPDLVQAFRICRIAHSMEAILLAEGNLNEISEDVLKLLCETYKTSSSWKDNTETSPKKQVRKNVGNCLQVIWLNCIDRRDFIKGYLGEQVCKQLEKIALATSGDQATIQNITKEFESITASLQETTPLPKDWEESWPQLCQMIGSLEKSARGNEQAKAQLSFSLIVQFTKLSVVMGDEDPVINRSICAIFQIAGHATLSSIKSLAAEQEKKLLLSELPNKGHPTALITKAKQAVFPLYTRAMEHKLDSEISQRMRLYIPNVNVVHRANYDTESKSLTRLGNIPDTPMITAIKTFLSDKEVGKGSFVLLLTGAAGIGKTASLFNLEQTALWQLRLGYKPLFIALKTIPQGETSLMDTPEIAEIVKENPEMKNDKVVLLVDAYDELFDLSRDLLSKVPSKWKVIVSCRSQYVHICEDSLQGLIAADAFQQRLSYKIGIYDLRPLGESERNAYLTRRVEMESRVEERAQGNEGLTRVLPQVRTTVTSTTTFDKYPKMKRILLMPFYLEQFVGLSTEDVTPLEGKPVQYAKIYRKLLNERFRTDYNKARATKAQAHESDIEQNVDRFNTFAENIALELFRNLEKVIYATRGKLRDDNYAVALKIDTYKCPLKSLGRNASLISYQGHWEDPDTQENWGSYGFIHPSFSDFLIAESLFKALKAKTISKYFDLLSNGVHKKDAVNGIVDFISEMIAMDPKHNDLLNFLKGQIGAREDLKSGFLAPIMSNTSKYSQ